MAHLKHAAVAGALLLLAAGANAQAINTTTPEYLANGWTAEMRQWMYQFDQGARIVPLLWYQALERPGSTEGFGADGLARFRYLPQAASSSNPRGLPVGFTIGKNGSTDWLGMNCNACHTGRIEVGQRVLQIDGMPGMGDLFGFISELSQALDATLADPARFQRFQRKVGGSPATLRRDVQRFADSFRLFVQQSTPTVAHWGPGRTDAFNMIFNRVGAIDLATPANAVTPNAPVSYPFVWSTNVQEVVQWPGIAPNVLGVERLTRNVGQTLGVFGQVPGMASKAAFQRLDYTSTVQLVNLIAADGLIGKLQPPKWPLELDRDAVTRGAAVWTSAGCGSCHTNWNGSNLQPLKVAITPVGEVGTDPLNATQPAQRTLATAALQGSPVFPIYPFKTYGASASAVELTAATAAHIIVKQLTSGRALTPAERQLLSWSIGTDDVIEQLIRDARYVAARVFSRRDDPPAAPGYKAGPLNGIWATGPYLHNGSVPTLWQLLTPSQRPAVFWTGSRELDPVGVGLRHDQQPGTFRFDTSLAGNRNTGHTYGSDLSDAQKRDLIEYMKSL